MSNTKMTSMDLPRYDRYKDSGVEWLGEIPNHWEVKRNFSIFQERKEVNRPNMPLLSVTITRGVIQQSEITAKKDSSNEDKSKYKVVYQGDLAYNKMRMWQGAIGFSEYDGIVSPAYIILNIFNKAKYYSKYFHYLYRTPLFIKEANRHSYGLCDDMNSLRYVHFKTIYSPIPSFVEQKRIAEFLDRKCGEIEEAIAKKQRLIELLEEQKAIVINQAVTKGLNPNAPTKDSGIDWLGAIPQHWKISKIGHYARVSNGSTPSRDKINYWKNGNIPWLSSGKVNDITITKPSELITKKALKECSIRLYPKGSVVIGLVGQGKTRGTSSILEIEACINQNMAAIEINDNLNGAFLLKFLSQAYQVIRNFGKGGNQEALNCDLVRSFKIAIPPIQEQLEIAIFLDEKTKEISYLQMQNTEQIKKLTELKQILIAEAVTGKIKV